MESSLKGFLKQVKENESVISMVLGALVVIIVGALLFNYFNESQQNAQITSESVATTAAETMGETELKTPEIVTEEIQSTHTVVKGEHLWAIAEKYYGSGYNYVDLIKANKLAANGQIEVGQEIKIPKVAAKLATKTSVAAPEVKKVSDSPTAYQVIKGDTLWQVAVKMYGDGFSWNRIYEANKQLIKDPGLIEVGWKLVIPR